LQETKAYLDSHADLGVLYKRQLRLESSQPKTNRASENGKIKKQTGDRDEMHHRFKSRSPVKPSADYSDSLHIKRSALSSTSNPANPHSDWKCKFHNADEHDFFINYRVSTEGRLASDLAYKILIQLDRDVKVFLDSQCLPFGESWQQSFIMGLKRSKIVVLLVSLEGLQNIKKAHEDQDSVLLEYEIARQRSVEGGVIVMPVWVGHESRNDKGETVYIKFKVPKVDEFPDLPHKTNVLASSKSTIRSTMEWLFSLQGFKLIDKSDLVSLIRELGELLTRASPHQRATLLKRSDP